MKSITNWKQKELMILARARESFRFTPMELGTNAETRAVRYFAMKTYISPNDLATRWDCHRTTAVRIMHRYGHAGCKFGTARTSSLRFTLSSVLDVEKRAGIKPSASDKHDGRGQ